MFSGTQLRKPKIKLDFLPQRRTIKNGTPNVKSANAGLSARSTSLRRTVTIVGPVVGLNILALDFLPLFLFVLLVCAALIYPLG